MSNTTIKAGRRPDWFGAQRRPQTVAGWLLVAPFVLVFLTFSLWPIIWSLMMSVTDMTSRDLRSPFSVDFVGFEQYARVLGDPKFLQSLGVTAVFVLVCMPLTLATGMALAIMLNSGIQKLRGAFRTAFYIPVVTNIVAIAVVWKFLFADEGIINAALGLVGIDGANWLQDPTWALPSLLLLVVWRTSGLVMIIFLAGLQGVPAELYEAAKVDGAGALRRIFSITLPLMRPSILLSAVLLSVAYVQVFEEPFVITRGGPLDSTTTAALYIYEQFGFGQYSVASAASYILFLVIGLFAVIQFRLLRPKA